MPARRLRFSLVFLLAIVIPTGLSWALGLQLGGTKEELKLVYDVAVKDHGTDRVTVVLTIADQGRLAPLFAVQLFVPDEKENNTGGHYADLSVALATREETGKQVARIHLLKSLADRAHLQLQTSHLDGKREPLTWYYHSIPIVDYIASADTSTK